MALKHVKDLRAVSCGVQIFERISRFAEEDAKKQSLEKWNL
jgi:hypothetical protein